MSTPRRECDEYVTTVVNPDLILSDGNQFSAASSAAHAAGNPLVAYHSLEAVLREVATSPTSVPREDTLNAIANRSVSDKRPASSNHRTHLASSARLENVVRVRIAPIPALVEVVIICLIRDGGRATE